MPERKERSGEKNGVIELVNRGYWHGNIGSSREIRCNKN